MWVLVIRTGDRQVPQRGTIRAFLSFSFPEIPNQFPVIHRANAKLFTIPPDSDQSASQPVDSLLITIGFVNIMDTVEYGTAKT
jgi:hypothetical protein